MYSYINIITLITITITSTRLCLSFSSISYHIRNTHIANRVYNNYNAKSLYKIDRSSSSKNDNNKGMTMSSAKVEVEKTDYALLFDCDGVIVETEVP